MVVNYIIAALQVTFMFTSATVERAYCIGPLQPDDTTPLVQQTIEFCRDYNPLFEARPTWLVDATCIHAYGFWILYSTIFVTAILDKWNLFPLQIMICLGIGAKLYAVIFYHYMEFTSEMPPPSPLIYFSAEGSYIVSIILVFYKIITASSAATTNVTAAVASSSSKPSTKQQ